MSPRMGLNLDTILKAAAEVANTQGLDQVKLATIAKNLGIRSPSIYNHVNGLTDLRNQLAIYGIKQLTDVMTQAAVGRSNDEAVHAIGEAYICFARNNPGVYEATHLAADSTNEELQNVSKELLNLVVRVLTSFSMEDEEKIHLVRGFRSLLHGFASLEQEGGFGLPVDLDDSFRFTLDTFLAGVYLQKKGEQE